MLLVMEASLFGGHLLIREAGTPGYLEIAAPIKDAAGKGGLTKYLIYSYPKEGNPSEDEIARHFARDLPFRINGVYLVVTITPQQSFQIASERCDLYLTLPRPRLAPQDVLIVAEDTDVADIYPAQIVNDEFIIQLLGNAISELFKKSISSGNIPFDIKAWLDGEGNPIIEKKVSLERIASGRSGLSGVLVRVNVIIPGRQGTTYVKVTGDILDYVSMRKYFVRIERDYQGEYSTWQGTRHRENRKNSVVAMICDQKLSCFDLPFVNGTIRCRDGIGGGGWRRVLGCDAFDVNAEMVKARKLNRLEEMLHGKQDWEIVLFLFYWAGIILFFYLQFVFVKDCGWKSLAWIFSLGMSAMAVGIFYFLYYREPFPYVDEVPMATTLYVYGSSLLGGLLYAVLRGKTKASIGMLLVVAETFAFLTVLYVFGHASG